MTRKTVIYTLDKWRIDRVFKAEAGQEISAEVYAQMERAAKPLRLPSSKAKEAQELYGVTVKTGFLMGEPHSRDEKGLLYLAFGMTDNKQGARRYYLGRSHEQEQTPAGKYYIFECNAAFLAGRLFKVADFEAEEDAIATAERYEAILYKIQVDEDGDQVARAVIYSPFDRMKEKNKKGGEKANGLQQLSNDF